MKKICYIISDDFWGGAETVIYDIISVLAKTGKYDISAIVFNEGKFLKKIKTLNIKWYLAEENEHSFLGLVKAVNKILEDIRPDLIHSNKYKDNVISWLSSRTLRDVKLITTQHGMSEFSEGRINLKQRIAMKINYIILNRFFEKIVAVSKDISSLLTGSHGLNPGKVVIIYNGIELCEKNPEHGGKTEFVIGSSGRLFPVKDYSMMIKTARILADKFNNVRFEIAGEGPEENNLRDLIRELELDDIFILRGNVDDMADFYRGIDLYLNTSVHEGLPLSVLEAMAFGVPIIAPDVGGIREVIEDGKDGYLVREREPFIFSEKCSNLILDDNVRRNISQNARKKIENKFTREIMTGYYADLYE